MLLEIWSFCLFYSGASVWWFSSRFRVSIKSLGAILRGLECFDALREPLVLIALKGQEIRKLMESNGWSGWRSAGSWKPYCKDNGNLLTVLSFWLAAHLLRLCSGVVWVTTPAGGPAGQHHACNEGDSRADWNQRDAIADRNRREMDFVWNSPPSQIHTFPKPVLRASNFKH